MQHSPESRREAIRLVLSQFGLSFVFYLHFISTHRVRKVTSRGTHVVFALVLYFALSTPSSRTTVTGCFTKLILLKANIKTFATLLESLCKAFGVPAMD